MNDIEQTRYELTSLIESLQELGFWSIGIVLRIRPEHVIYIADKAELIETLMDYRRVEIRVDGNTGEKKEQWILLCMDSGSGIIADHSTGDPELVEMLQFHMEEKA